MAELFFRGDQENTTSRVTESHPLPVTVVTDPVASGTLDTNQITGVANVPTKIVDNRNERQRLVLLNTGTGTCAVGVEGKIATTGFPLVAGSSMVLHTKAAVYGFGTAAWTVAYVEEYD